MREELKQRLTQEFRYASTKMQEENNLNKKLFYFSAIFGETQRSLNWEWEAEIALIHMVTNHIYQQINTQIQQPGILQLLPINWAAVFDKLTLVASDLATYFESGGDNKEEIYRILINFAEISYSVTGNGSYLLEKGAFNIQSSAKLEQQL